MNDQRKTKKQLLEELERERELLLRGHAPEKDAEIHALIPRRGDARVQVGGRLVGH